MATSSQIEIDKILNMSLAQLKLALKDHPTLSGGHGISSTWNFTRTQESGEEEKPLELLTPEERHKVIERVKEHFRTEPQRLENTTVADVLRGWKKNAKAYMEDKDGFARTFHKIIMCELLQGLQFLGFPQWVIDEIQYSREILAGGTLIDSMIAYEKKWAGKTTPPGCGL